MISFKFQNLPPPILYLLLRSTKIAPMSQKIATKLEHGIGSGFSHNLDPDLDSAKCLDTDPDSVNPDPKRW